MNHYGAVQGDDGRYRYLAQRGDAWTAEGYCGDCDGHATADDADAHFTAYLLDTRLSLNLGDPAQAWTCAVDGCDQPTHRRAECYGQVWPLCAIHMTRATVAQLMPRIGPHDATW